MSNSPVPVEIRSVSLKYDLHHHELTGPPNFMFDVRGLNNPGRVPEIKHLSGLDGPVADYLDNDDGAQTYWEHVKGALEPALDRAVERGYPIFRIWFACTGGRHRSVYFAAKVADWLAARDDVGTEVRHLDIDSDHSNDDSQA